MTYNVSSRQPSRNAISVRCQEAATVVVGRSGEAFACNLHLIMRRAGKFDAGGAAGESKRHALWQQSTNQPTVDTFGRPR